MTPNDLASAKALHALPLPVPLDPPDFWQGRALAFRAALGALLAHVDALEAEREAAAQACADLLADRNHDDVEAGRRLERGEVVGAVRQHIDRSPACLHLKDFGHWLEARGPARTLPPTEALLRVRALEAALREILREVQTIDLHSDNKVLHVERMARAALEARP